MRPSQRLLAQVAKAAGNYLTPHQPTGLAGVLTHPFPRPHSSTSTQRPSRNSHNSRVSVYRQATEALTKQRLAVVEKTVPAGFNEWQDRVNKQMQEDPELAAKLNLPKLTQNGKPYVMSILHRQRPDERVEEWGGDPVAARTEGPGTAQEKINQARDFGAHLDHRDLVREDVEYDNEPPLTVQQWVTLVEEDPADTIRISDMEMQLAAGLIEEVITVAEGELQLVDTMLESAA